MCKNEFCEQPCFLKLINFDFVVELFGEQTDKVTNGWH